MRLTSSCLWDVSPASSLTICYEVQAAWRIVFLSSPVSSLGLSVAPLLRNLTLARSWSHQQSPATMSHSVLAQLLSAQREIQSLRQTISHRHRKITNLRESVAELEEQKMRMEEQKMRMAFDIESTRATARFLKRKVDTLQARVPVASQNRPQEPGLQPEEKKKKKLAQSSWVEEQNDDEQAQQEKEEEEAEEEKEEEPVPKPRATSCWDRVTSASRPSSDPV